LQHYRIHFIDRLGVHIFVRDWSAPDDDAAILEGRSLARGHAIEVWCGERRIAAFASAEPAGSATVTS
jgi:hypothetical protein